MSFFVNNEAEVKSEEVFVAPAEVTTEEVAATPTEVTTEEVVVTPKKAKRVAKPKVVNGKVKVKKTNGEQKIGRASAVMTKPETITTVQDIPTEFIAVEDRASYVVSGKTATTADVVNRSSAGPTKPSL